MEPAPSKPIGRKCRGVVIASSVIIVITVLIMNALMREGLFINGVNFIAFYQDSQSATFFKVVHNLISLACNPVFVGPVLGLEYLITHRKLLSLIHVTYFLFATGVMAVMKQAFQDTRPIWYTTEINRFEWFCPKDYGNPSGHSFCVFILYEPIFADFLGRGRFKWTWIILILLGVLVPLSRLYLGVHSANQVLLGSVLGLAFIVMFRYGLQKALYKLYFSLFARKRLPGIVGVVIMHAISLGVPILVFLVNKADRRLPQNEIDNLNSACELDPALTSTDGQESMLESIALVGAVFGIIYGLFLLECSRKNRDFLTGKWKYKDKCSALKHLLLQLVLAGIPSLLCFVLVGRLVDNVYVVYFMASIGTVLSGVFLLYASQSVTVETDWIIYESQTLDAHTDNELGSNVRQK